MHKCQIKTQNIIIIQMFSFLCLLTHHSDIWKRVSDCNYFICRNQMDFFGILTFQDILNFYVDVKFEKMYCSLAYCRAEDNEDKMN